MIKPSLKANHQHVKMSLPEFPLNVAEEIKEEIESWYSTYVYEKLAEKDPNNIWVKIGETIDFSPVEAACEEYHKRTSGKNVPHKVKQMVRALFVKYMLGTSVRMAAERIQYDMQIKRFVGYELHDNGCHYSTLSRFDQWVQENKPRIYFDTVLKEVDKRYGKQEREKIQLADTFAVEANAAKVSLVKLLREMGERLIIIGAVTNECAEGELWSKVDKKELFGEANETHWSKLKAEERNERLFKTVCGALACQKVVEKLPIQKKALLARLKQLKKILSDEFAITYNDAGKVIEVERLPKNKRGEYRIGSAVDPEATYREHGKGKSTFGYNASVAVTDEFVREARVDTGATPDAKPIPSLLEAQKEHHDHLPEKLIYDKAAGDGKTASLVHKATDGKTQLVAEMRDYGKNSKQFTPSDFHYDKENKTLTCPNGQTSSSYSFHHSGSGLSFRFPRKKHGCETCPLFQGCYKKTKTQTRRTVFISFHFDFFLLAVAYMTCDQFRHEMRQRNHVERIISALVNHNDARRARGRGTAATDFQIKMAASTYNTKKLLRKIQIDLPLG